MLRILFLVRFRFLSCTFRFLSPVNSFGVFSFFVTCLVLSMFGGACVHCLSFVRFFCVVRFFVSLICGSSVWLSFWDWYVGLFAFVAHVSCLYSVFVSFAFGSVSLHYVQIRMFLLVSFVDQSCFARCRARRSYRVVLLV